MIPNSGCFSSTHKNLTNGPVVLLHSVHLTDSVIPVSVSGTGGPIYASLSIVSTENSSTRRSGQAGGLGGLGPKHLIDMDFSIDGFDVARKVFLLSSCLPTSGFTLSQSVCFTISDRPRGCFGLFGMQ
jgi:hypothetical protein